MSAMETLLEMGFSENSAKKALSVTGGGVEAAMEWLLAHADDPGINDPPQEQEKPKDQPKSEEKPKEQEKAEPMEEGESGGGSEGGEDKSGEGAGTSAEAKEESKEEEEAKSIKCDDCGKLFKTSEEVEFHAVKSGHSNFSESTEEKKPLSEEEKAEKKRKLEDKIKQRRREREQEEEKEIREREKRRIKMGQEIAERKRVMQEMEMKRIADERKREKMEDKLARERVKEQIERDKAARKEMFSNSTDAQSSAAAPKPAPQPAAVAAGPKKEYNTARLQIRLPSGSPMVKEFQAKESLSAVRLWISLNREDGIGSDEPVNLSMSFPRKLFTDEDMHKPLSALGLVPSAVLMVSK